MLTTHWDDPQFPTTVACKDMFQREMGLICYRMRGPLVDQIKFWLQQL
jgi:hypothetical protein